MKKWLSLLLVLMLLCTVAAGALGEEPAEDNPKDVSFLPKLIIPKYTLTYDENSGAGNIARLKFSYINEKNKVGVLAVTEMFLGDVVFAPIADAKKHTVGIDNQEVTLALNSGCLVSETIVVERSSDKDNAYYYLFPVTVDSRTSEKSYCGAVLIYKHTDPETQRVWKVYKFERQPDLMYVATWLPDGGKVTWFGINAEGETVKVKKNDPLRQYAEGESSIAIKDHEMPVFDGAVPGI